MAADLKAARAAVYAALKTLDGFDVIYGYEPDAERLGGAYTVTVSTAGMSVTEWLINVRVYSSTGTDLEGSADNLDDGMQTVDDALVNLHGVTTEWSVEWSPDHGAWVGACTISMPREDF